MKELAPGLRGPMASGPKLGAPCGRWTKMDPVQADDYILFEMKNEEEKTMMDFAVLAFILGILFYLTEVASENPSVVHAAVFLGAAIEAITFMALRA